METTIYNVDYFIAKFSAIPEELWTVHTQINAEGQSCAFGHCRHNFNEYQGLQSVNCLIRGLLRLTKTRGFMEGNGGIANINNGAYLEYQQPTPKQRILAALYDIRAKQQSEVKERIVYVIVDQKVRELQKAETLTN